MKQLSTIAFITTIWLFPLPTRAESELEVAFKSGLDTATLDHEFRVARYGFSGGVEGHLQWFLSDRFSLAGQVELLYTPRGTEVVVGGTSQGKLRQHYLDAVVAARPEAWFGRISLYLLLGGGINFLVRADSENAAGLSQDATNDLRRIDVALLVGAGAAWHFPPRGAGGFRIGAVSLEARHDQGLIDIDKMNGGFKNRTSSLMLGVSFMVGSSASPAKATGQAE
jgi:hypothetical protein